MATIAFSIEERPIITAHCHYCEETIEEAYCRIDFVLGQRLRLHVDTCWEEFYSGVLEMHNQIIDMLERSVN